MDEACLQYDSEFRGKTDLYNLIGGDNVIFFRTFARVYGVAALSIGYAVAPGGLANFLREKGLGDTHALHRLSIVASEAAIADTATLKKMVREANAEREKWNVSLDENHIEHTDSRVNFCFFQFAYSQGVQEEIFFGKWYNRGAFFYHL